MASKTISVTEETYEMLKRLKLPNESFGDVLKKLIEEKLSSTLVDWVNSHELWEKLDEKELESIKMIEKRENTSFTITKVDNF
ncbi:antitoxin VapB family protein [Candidatus Lokiarchaeum ossiferum]|uniref:antitoxin VapB family protein n=1 Tax=Candidatus Lokiarchaeum ossiferum TaxID=2951803 RepID=UPI00352FDC52